MNVPAILAENGMSWEDVFSDHLPLTIQLMPGLHVLSWNILRQALTRGSHRNNPFSYTESEEEYIRRRHRIVGALAETVRADEALGIIALQETARTVRQREELTALLHEALPGQWQALYVNGDSIQALDTLTLIRRSQVEMTGQAQATQTGARGAKVLTSPLAVCGCRFTLHNVHLSWKHDHRPATDRLIRSVPEGHICMIGDCNTEAEEMKAYYPHTLHRPDKSNIAFSSGSEPAFGNVDLALVRGFEQACRSKLPDRVEEQVGRVFTAYAHRTG